MARCSTSLMKKGKWCWSSSGQAGAYPMPHRSRGSRKSNTPYHNRGLQVVGINVDVQEEGGRKLETVLPNIRRFLLDYNVPGRRS